MIAATLEYRLDAEARAPLSGFVIERTMPCRRRNADGALMFDHVMYPPVSGEFIAFWVGVGLMCLGTLLFVAAGITACVQCCPRRPSQSSAKAATRAATNAGTASSVIDI